MKSWRKSIYHQWMSSFFRLVDDSSAQNFQNDCEPNCWSPSTTHALLVLVFQYTRINLIFLYWSSEHHQKLFLVRRNCCGDYLATLTHLFLMKIQAVPMVSQTNTFSFPKLQKSDRCIKIDRIKNAGDMLCWILPSLLHFKQTMHKKTYRIHLS